MLNSSSMTQKRNQSNLGKINSSKDMMMMGKHYRPDKKDYTTHVGDRTPQIQINLGKKMKFGSPKIT